MRIRRKHPVHFLFCVLLAVVGGAAAAGERCDIAYTNGLDETILSIRTRYSTPYDEPRHSSSQITLPPGGDYRIGVQGVILPEMIIIDLDSKSYVFKDLSGLTPSSPMHIVVARENGVPLLRLKDGGGEAEGSERAYLTVANRLNAVDKDEAMHVATFAELNELIDAGIAEAREESGALETADVEAGPIWNQAHALERCPEVAEEWGRQNDRQARWTGQWRTTVPGEMSVCECMAGTADREATVTVEDDGWGKRIYFPVVWEGITGVGIAPEKGESSAGLPVFMRFRLSGDAVPETLDELFSDLRVDGYRVVNFSLQAADADEDGDPVNRFAEEVDFRETDGDKWDAHERVVEAVTAGFARAHVRGEISWIEEGAFDKLKAGEEIPATRCVFGVISGTTLEVLFVPDGEGAL